MGSLIREKCGVFGIVGGGSELQYCILGLRALQHRGQEAAGVAILNNNNDKIRFHHASGIIDELSFYNALHTDYSVKGSAIGHVRYSTSKDKNNPNNIDAQPLVLHFDDIGDVAIAHNGNFVNAVALRAQMEREGYTFTTGMDTEVFGMLMKKSEMPDLIDKIRYAASIIKGGYSLSILHKNCVIGLRDPLAIRPLVLGIVDKNYVIASESCAIDTIGAEFIKDIAGGEMVILRADSEPEFIKIFPEDNNKCRHCVFEYVYFSRLDSVVDGISIYKARKRVGAVLAEKYPVKDADIVTPVPDSSVAAAIGYAEASGLPFELGVIKNNYVGRTFIEPSNTRSASLHVKHNVNRSVVRGKSVVLIDDSLVRGNTARRIVGQMRESGVKAVHMRITSPPVKHCCYYGIDTPGVAELLSSRVSEEDLASMLQLDSLKFIDTDDLYYSTIGCKRNDASPQFCDACFTGDYPIPVTDQGEPPGYVSHTGEIGKVILRKDNVTSVIRNVLRSKVLDFNLLKLDELFIKELSRFSLRLNREKPYGLHIFLNNAAIRHMDFTLTGDVNLNEFIKHCKITEISDLDEIFVLFGEGADNNKALYMATNIYNVQATGNDGDSLYEIKPGTGAVSLQFIEINDV